MRKTQTRTVTKNDVCFLLGRWLDEKYQGMRVGCMRADYNSFQTQTGMSPCELLEHAAYEGVRMMSQYEACLRLRIPTRKSAFPQRSTAVHIRTHRYHGEHMRLLLVCLVLVHALFPRMPVPLWLGCKLCGFSNNVCSHDLPMMCACRTLKQCACTEP